MATDRYIDLLKQGFMKPARKRVNSRMLNRFEVFTDLSGSISYAQTKKEACSIAAAFIRNVHVATRDYACVYVRDRADNCDVVAEWTRNPAKGNRWFRSKL